ncbi:diacylglycerol kinase [Brevibacillus humidisoli]|uniref:diacylglycerol kinase n=1 Tax=Brevibacillus humidisoli TaxID=2895522 RepID=UPI001E33AE65|nr:diacylglycerol kinase [Brevibacillus humidisoli]UFJ41072.1 diacylglycerol kinase [Brevibacillus humidisoli]
MIRARLIYNPSSGREVVRRRLPDILDFLEEAGFETSCYATKGKNDATKEAERAVARGFDVVIAAGGDGTIYEVVNGIAEKKHRPSLGIIPCGTSNDLARALNIPRSIGQACEIITNGRTKRIDLGRVNDRYFINIAGGGSFTELTYEVPSKLKTMLGQLAYYVKGIEKLPSIRPTRMRLQTRDKVVIDDEIMLFLVANSHSVGGFHRLAPSADLSDGLLDCLVLKKTSLPDFVRLATMAIKGDHIKDPNILYFQTDYLKAVAPESENVQLNLDGELGGRLPCECRALRGHLEVFVP